MRLVDLSRPLENTVPADPPGLGPRIEYSDHTQSLAGMLAMFPGLEANQLPKGEAWAVELLTVSTHNGTHVDAPWHFASTMNAGERAWTIDEVPLDWFYRPGVKLDFREFAGWSCRLSGGNIRAAGSYRAPVEAVRHRADEYSRGRGIRNSGYVDSGCGFGREATLWLLERGVRVMGTDGWSWDAPFSFTRRRFLESRDPSIIWEGHKASLEIGYCHIEKLANLEQLPASGLPGCCFPFKIKSASAGFTRAVALLGRKRKRNS